MKARLFCVLCGERRYKWGDYLCATCRETAEFVAMAEQVMRERLIVPQATVPPEADEAS